MLENTGSGPTSTHPSFFLSGPDTHMCVQEAFQTHMIMLSRKLGMDSSTFALFQPAWPWSAEDFQERSSLKVARSMRAMPTRAGAGL